MIEYIIIIKKKKNGTDIFDVGRESSYLFQSL